MAVKTFDASQVTIVFNGVIVSGFADGDFINVARNNPTWIDGTGSDGEGWRAKSSDNSGTITITILQTSKSNDALNIISKLDELTGDGVGPFLMKDLSGTSLAAAATAWIEKPADQVFGREVGNREWVIKTDNLVTSPGGNPTA